MMFFSTKEVQINDDLKLRYSSGELGSGIIILGSPNLEHCILNGAFISFKISFR